MASVQAKTGWERMRKRKNKNYRSVPTRLVIKNPKKFKKLKSTIMDTFQAIISWKRKRNRENKNYRSVSLLPDA